MVMIPATCLAGRSNASAFSAVIHKNEGRSNSPDFPHTLASVSRFVPLSLNNFQNENRRQITISWTRKRCGRLLGKIKPRTMCAGWTKSDGLWAEGNTPHLSQSFRMQTGDAVFHDIPPQERRRMA